MSIARRKSLSTLRESSDVHVVLVTASTLETWIDAETPLHPGYRYLSSTHKSDYLRSYFMLKFGGGYCDIKPLRISWSGAFAELSDDTVAFYGAPEQQPWHVAGTPEMQSNFSTFASNGAFLFRAGTDFAAEWHSRVNAVLDQKFHLLRTNPGTYHPRAIRKGIHGSRWQVWNHISRGYPLEWTQLQGDIFHQLQWERPDDYRLRLPPLAYTKYR